jgi:hypothetical protein
LIGVPDAFAAFQVYFQLTGKRRLTEVAQASGASLSTIYARHGLTLRPASTHRITGWAEILRRFGDPAGGVQPTLFIHRRCARLIDSLPALQHDPNNPEDVLKMDLDEEGIGGDDAADALRYLVATRLPQIHVKRLLG